MVTAWIQAHPSREALWPDLVASLAPLPTEISVHESTPPSPWAGYQQALQRVLEDPRKPSHALIVQEDVIVCRNFPLAVERIAEAKPDEPVCLFLSWLPGPIARDARQAMKTGDRYVRARAAQFLPALGIIWPLSVAESFLEWTQTAKLPGAPGLVRSDDAVIGEWARRTRSTVWVTCPSLIEHPDHAVSTIGRRAHWGKDRGRVALNWIGPDADPLALDW